MAGLLTLLLSLLLTASLWAAPSRLQFGTNFTTVGVDSADVSGTTAGNTLLVCWCAVWQGGGFSTVNPVFSDTQGNTWAVAINRGINDAASDLHRIYLGYAISTTAAPVTVTCNPPGTDTGVSMVVAEYAGTALASPLDKTATNASTAGSTSVTSGTTAATARASELLVAGMVYGPGDSTTITETAPLVLVAEQETTGLMMDISAVDRILTAAGTYNAAWTLGASRPWAAFVATFLGTRRVIRNIGP